MSAESNSTETMELSPQELQSVEKLQDGFTKIRRELAKTVVGQDQVIEELLIA